VGETGGNVGIILLEDSVAAVDAQYPVSGADFRRSISRITSNPVTHLLLTHYHGDHIFGNQAFEDCEIVGHRLLKELMEVNLRSTWANLEEMLKEVRKTKPEKAWLYEGLKIVLPTMVFEKRFAFNGIEMIHMGGHTGDSSIILVPDDQILFAGDLVFAKRFPWGGDASADPDLWIQAFKMILDLDAEMIVPGHGPLCDKTEIKVHLEWFEAVREEMKRLIEEGVSIEEAVEYEAYPDFYDVEADERRDETLKHWYQVWLRRFSP
jgi:glyoxylase-like metal-dependent hydrolase (beta-lactamase superfamily II)